MTDSFHILIVDDEPNIRSGLAKGLAKEANLIKTASTYQEALQEFEANSFNLVIADIRLPGERDGLDLISEIRRRSPTTIAIVITAHGTVETAVDAMRRGAFDFISKPIDLGLIRQQTKKALEFQRLQEENRQLRFRLANVGEVSGIIGNCGSFQDVLQLIRQVADTDATVLIRGESGTGKELIARALHDLSGRSGDPFVAVNLGALPESLLESELFGHEVGAFTGATRQKPGCFEQASPGTLFLDEITEIPAKSQVDLLRVLETGQFRRVGGENSLVSTARIVSATNRDIESLVQEGTFREDLYYRLNIVPIEVPPLRARCEDIPLLANHFFRYFCERHRRPAKSISDEAMQIFISSRWPGNIRQLRNVVERLVVTVNEDLIVPAHLPRELDPHIVGLSTNIAPLVDTTEAAERQAIQSALAACDYHRERTAEALKISLRTLHYKMRRHGLY